MQQELIILSATATLALARSMSALIERHLSAAFDQLDAETGDIEMRQKLHAAFISEAIISASSRFPQNDALIRSVDEALTLINDHRWSVNI